MENKGEIIIYQTEDGLTKLEANFNCCKNCNSPMWEENEAVIMDMLKCSTCSLPGI